MNGKDERKNRTLCELVVATLLNSGAASYWWGEIILTVFYVLNRVPNSKTYTSPIERWLNRKPNVFYFLVWGCLAYVRIPDLKRSKLASRAYECAFIGYAIHSKAYRFYDIKNNVIIEPLDVDFFEDKFPFKSKNSGGGGSSENKIVNELNLSKRKEPDTNIPELRRSVQLKVAKDFGFNFYAFTLDSDPITLEEAYKSSDSELWQEAMNDEMDSLQLNKTWKLVNLPTGCKTIGCKCNE